MQSSYFVLYINVANCALDTSYFSNSKLDTVTGLNRLIEVRVNFNALTYRRNHKQVKRENYGTVGVLQHPEEYVHRSSLPMQFCQNSDPTVLQKHEGLTHVIIASFDWNPRAALHFVILNATLM